MKRTRTLRPSSAERVIDLLVEHGWLADGATPTEHVRVGTAQSPVYGGIGGVARTFGGRVRFHKPGTDLYATVGRNSISFYHRQNGQAAGFRNYATSSEFDYIARAVGYAATSEMPHTAAEIAREAMQREQAARYEQERIAAQAAREAALEAGERILVMTGTKGRLYERKGGCVVVYWAHPTAIDGRLPEADTEVPVCCWKRGRWLIQTMHRSHAIGDPDEHDDDCPQRDNPS